MAGLPAGGMSSAAPVNERWLSRLLGRVADVAEAALGPADEASQRQDVLRRALVAPAIIISILLDQLHFPGWQALPAACAVAVAYDAYLAYLVFLKKRFFAARVLAFVLDALLLTGAGLFVLRAMGLANSTSDIWLAFLVFVVSGGFALAPIGALIYTALTMVWFALGTLLFYPSDSHYYDQLPIRLFFFAAFGLISLGMAAELQKRRARLETQNRQTMAMLATLVEARDTDAGAHLHRIQHFSRVLALHLGFSERGAQEIAQASLMHDVGKANVPDAILKKPGPLSPDDWLIMRRHTVWGEQLLAEHADFDLARQVARWHHERWDGQGYPDGLGGPRLPLAVRIVSVADVFDALISERPYKPAWSPEAAIEELQRIAGSHLDPDIVAAFVDLYRRGVIQLITRELHAEPGRALLAQAA